jgi:hypothetical protein
MKKVLFLLMVTAVVLVGVLGFDGVRDATTRVVGTGQSAIEAGRSIVDAGTQAAGQARDTVDAVSRLDDACDLVRTAIEPQTPAGESATLLNQALGIVSGVVTDYPDTPGVSDLADFVTTAEGVLAVDPTGQLLKANPQAVESACAQLPPIP